MIDKWEEEKYKQVNCRKNARKKFVGRNIVGNVIFGQNKVNF